MLILVSSRKSKWSGVFHEKKFFFLFNSNNSIIHKLIWRILAITKIWFCFFKKKILFHSVSYYWNLMWTLAIFLQRFIYLFSHSGDWEVFLILFVHFWQKSPPKKMMSSKDSLFRWGSYDSTTFFVFYGLPQNKSIFLFFATCSQYHFPKIQQLHSCKQAIVNLYLPPLPQVWFPVCLLWPRKRWKEDCTIPELCTRYYSSQLKEVMSVIRRYLLTNLVSILVKLFNRYIHSTLPENLSVFRQPAQLYASISSSNMGGILCYSAIVGAKLCLIIGVRTLPQIEQYT